MKGGKATVGGGSGNGAPDLAMRYCPPYVAPNKAGRPKEGKRKKGCLEGKKPKKRKGTTREATDDWNRKQADRAFGTDYCLRSSFVILLS